ASTPAASSPASSGSLPDYTPSTVVSRAMGHVQLTTPDSVRQVTAFYDRALSQGGWSIISASKTTYSTNITATRGHTGTTLAIASAGSLGTSISISTYHV
ncbi:MAG TPA: hypothetical protein VF834_16040, partial [Streptosporangiaceae bacterium]